MDPSPPPSPPSRSWTAELLLLGSIGAWIAYELYGRHMFELVNSWWFYIRIAGGIVALVFLYFQFRARPEEFTMDSLALAKQLLSQSGGGGAGGSGGSGGGGGTAEKRNVSSLLKKKIAASQQWKCGSCSATLDETYEVDHRLALYKGGSNDPSNLVALCPNCHRKKTVEERLT